MWEETVIRFCSPTLANIKTGSLFMFTFRTVNEMYSKLLSMNRHVLSKGIRVIPLRITNTKALIYAYRPSKLRKDLSCDVVANILKEKGYPIAHFEHCIAHLISRLKGNEFPHEIGLFLGYPPMDVLGFIKYKAKAYKCFGEWMVYDDEEEAKRTFARYKQCTDAYMAMYKSGKTLDMLAVKSN